MTTYSRFLRNLAVLAVAYWLAAVLGLQWAALGGAGSPVWPAAGIALVGLLLGGVRLWPAIVIGRLAAALTLGTLHPLWVELMIAGGNALAAVLPVLALQRYVRMDFRLTAVRDVLWLALASIGGAAIAALVGTGALWLSVDLAPPYAIFVGMNWWSGNAVGSLTVAPLVLAWSARGFPVMGKGDWLHFAVLLIVTAGLSAAVFLDDPAAKLRAWHVFPVLIWAALAFHVRGAAVALLIVSALAVWGATTGTGPFIGYAEGAAERLLYAQEFAIVAALATLILAAVADERRGKEALKEAEAAVRRKEAQLRQVLESTTDSVILLDREWRFVYLNERARTQIAQGRDLAGMNIWDAFPDAVRGPFWYAFHDAERTGRPSRTEAYYAPLGKTLEANAYPSDEGLAVFFRDVTEQRRAAAALAESETRLRAVLEQMPIGVAVAEIPSGRLLFHNTRAVEVLGHPMLESADYKDYGQYGALHADGTPFRPEEHPLARAVLFGQEVHREQILYRRGDGRLTTLEASAAPIHDVQGHPVLAVSTFEDVGERNAKEEALKESEARLRLAQTAGGIATWEWHLHTDRVAWSGPVQDVFGLPPDRGVPSYLAFLSLVYPDDRAGVDRALQQALHGNRPYDLEFRIVRPDGTVRWLAGRGNVIRDAAGEPVRMMGVNFDVTDRREATEALNRLNADLERRVAESAAELVQLQKMESLGRLTGGIAHDFNNLLMAVLSNLEVLRKRCPNHEPELEHLINHAIEGARRGAELTQRMLAFARKQDLDTRPVELPALVDGMADLLKRSLGPQVEITTRFAPGLPKALVDPHQLEVAILNLALNARDAMPGGGELTIAVDAVRIEAGTPLSAGRYLRLRVIDAGTGMDADTLRRATEPFFTTKDVGKGTGLGLSMVDGLAEQLGGRFTLTSAVGHGTTAELLLPVADAEETQAPSPAEAPGPEPETPEPETPEPETPRPKTLSVLVVDDDALVRMGLVSVLQVLGHVPIEADSGREALAILRSGRAVDVVVTDQAMPDMTGLQLAVALRKEGLAVPVILATGYADLPEGAAGIVAERLRKPFQEKDLVAALARATELAGVACRGP